MPHLVPPMLPATAGEPPTGPDWRIEVAWTGHRCIAYVNPAEQKVRLLSGADNSMGQAYPELTEPLLRRCPPGGMVLDGTIVARGEEHAPRARLLKRRHARHRPSEQEIRAVPVDLQVSDLLWLDGHSTVDLPFRDRRALLEGLGFAGAPVWTTALFPTGELDSIMRIAAGKGVEAFHVRHLAGRYRPGGRSRFWVRVPVPRTGRVLIGGWTPTDPRRPDTVATLLLGVPEPAGLRYVGRVGVGAGQRRALDALLGRAAQVALPFASAVPADAARNAIGVEPRLVGQVEFTGWTGGAGTARMRLPHWRGLVTVAEDDDQPWVAPPDPAHPARPLPAAEPGVAAPARLAEPDPTTVDPAAVPAAAPPAAGPGVQARRLEQHFVYNTLNTIAALIRTDPARARELLFGFADLSRAADGPPDTTLARELDAVRAYLQLEQARFGARLQVVVDVDDGLGEVPVAALRLLAVVRAAVQDGIEPLPAGGLLTVTARRVDGGCVLSVIAGAGPPVAFVLPAAAGPG